MKSHISTITSRMIRAGLRNNGVRYRVIACGIDHKNRIVSIATNLPRLPLRGLHAEERIIHNSPRSLVKILLLRVNARGLQLPIDPCNKCMKLAKKRGIRIESI